MNKNEIEERLYRVISELFEIKVDEIHLNSSFEKDFLADSLDGAELVMLIEDEFEIKIEDEDASKFLIVRSVINYLEKNLE